MALTPPTNTSSPTPCLNAPPSSLPSSLLPNRFPRRLLAAAPSVPASPIIFMRSRNAHDVTSQLRSYSRRRPVMKSLLPAALLLLIPLSLRSQAVPTTGDPTHLEKENCTVAGTVLRLDTGEPLKKAIVVLIGRESQGESVLDFTDGAGHFRFEDIEAGSYTLFVMRSGFVGAHYGQRKLEDPGAVLTLHRGQEITDLVFKLVRMGVI